MATPKKVLTFSLAMLLVAGVALPVTFAKFGHGRGDFSPEKNIQETKENIANGVIIQKTSTDADVVKRLQEHTPPAPKDTTISFVKENIANGVKLTITSSDATKVKEIQTGPKGGHKGGFGKMHKPLVAPKFETLSNGIALTFTSDDAAIVTKLKAEEHFPPFLKDDKKVEVKKEELTNGVKVTLTSTDADTVKKLQDMQNHKPGEGKRHGEGRGKHGLKKSENKG